MRMAVLTDGPLVARKVEARLGGLALVATMVGCLGLASGAQARHPPGEVDGNVPAAVQNALGGEVTELPNGLYEVDLKRGPPQTTHGPDFQGEIKPNHGSTLGPGDPERPPVCATDYYQHVLYAHRAADPNQLATHKAQIQASMRRINAVLNEESLESGGVTADYKVLCDAGEEIRVDSFASNGTSFKSVVSAAKAAGFNDPDVDYTIFFDYDHPSICGVGSFSSDETLSVNNANNSGGDYGISYDGCWDGVTTMHENGHNQGAVQYNAPYSTGDGAHCWDENDVMCYSPDGGDLHQEGTISRCTDRIHFDCGNDSYFDTAPETGEYLATNWNIGSTLNRFVVVNAAGNVPPPVPDPPAGSGEPEPGSGNPPDTDAPPDDAEAISLTNKTPHPDTAAAAGHWRLYTIKVPRHRSRLAVTLDCGEPCPDELDLYVRRGSDPTLTAFNCRSAGPGSDESCRIRSPRRGAWHIGVYTAAGAGGTPFEITARHRR
jgi:hypothetical protein